MCVGKNSINSKEITELFYLQNKILFNLITVDMIRIFIYAFIKLDVVMCFVKLRPGYNLCLIIMPKNEFNVKRICSKIYKKGRCGV